MHYSKIWIFALRNSRDLYRTNNRMCEYIRYIYPPYHRTISKIAQVTLSTLRSTFIHRFYSPYRTEDISILGEKVCDDREKIWQTMQVSKKDGIWSKIFKLRPVSYFQFLIKLSSSFITSRAGLRNPPKFISADLADYRNTNILLQIGSV